MWNRVLTTIVLIIIIVLGLNFYIGMALSDILHKELTQASSQWDNHRSLKLGSVSSSPFQGDISLHDIRYHNIQNGTSLDLKKILIDLSYVDFLRLYLLGPQKGLSAIKSTQLLLEELEIRNLAPLNGFSASRAEISYLGNMAYLLQSYQTGALPNSSIRLETTVHNMTLSPFENTTASPLRADTFTGSLTFESGFSTLLVQDVKLTGEDITFFMDGQLVFDPTKRNLKALNRYKLTSKLDYESSSYPFPVYDAPWGSVNAERIRWNAELSQNLKNSSGLIDLMHTTGQIHTEISKVSYKPSTAVNKQYAFILSSFITNNTSLPIERFQLDATANEQTITINSALIDYSQFDISATGDIIRHRSDFSKSLLNNFTLSLEDVSPEQQQFITNLSSLLGVGSTNSRGNWQLELMGTVGTPRISN